MDAGVSPTGAPCITGTVTPIICATCGSMKDKLETQDARIAELEKHILSLETDLPILYKKKRLDSIGTTEEQDK